MARPRTLLPDQPRGMRRVGDRRAFSGIVQMLISGERRVDATAACGTHKTLTNRWVCRALSGV